MVFLSLVSRGNEDSYSRSREKQNGSHTPWPVPSSRGCLSLSRCLSTGLCVPGALERMTKRMNDMVGGLGDLLGITWSL